MAGGAPEISLGQKYLTTADPFDPNYNTPDQHRDLKKLSCPNVICSSPYGGAKIAKGISHTIPIANPPKS